MIIRTLGHWRGPLAACRGMAPEFKGRMETLMSPMLGHQPEDVNSNYDYLAPALADDDDASLLNGLGPQEMHGLLEDLASQLALIPTDQEPTSTLPAVYTYFGQFLNHDISAPGPPGGVNVPQLETPIVNDPDQVSLSAMDRPADAASVLSEVVNQHRWPLTLDSLYGGGPFAPDTDAETRALYNQDGTLFELGQTVELPSAELAKISVDPSKKILTRPGAPDLLRDHASQRARIVDSRNDENLIVSQLHLAFMMFHNNAAEALKSAGHGKASEQALFGAARDRAVWHYQWCVVHDYLRHLLDPGIYKRAMTEPGYCPPRHAVPMEFAAAVFRFGHSMVGSNYDYNENFKHGGAGGVATLTDLFDFTSKGGMRKSVQLPNHWVADWTMLADRDAANFSRADRIDPILVGLLLGLPKHLAIDLASIAKFNLLRGFHRRVPFGQRLAKEMGVAELSQAEIRSTVSEVHGMYDFLKVKGLHLQTPAWLYVLCEARARGGGNRLGPMASAVVAKTTIGLLRGNPNSVLYAKGGAWKPSESELRTKAGKPIADIKSFLRFAGGM